MASNRVIRRDAARRDILTNARYIAVDDPRAAFRFMDAVDATIEFLASTPRAGSEWEGAQRKHRGLRYFRVRDFDNYVVFYRALKNGIEVVRVLHGAQDLDSLL